MTLAIPLSADTEARLAAKASAAGVDIVTYARAVLAREALVDQPALDEILAPVREKFAASGMTEDEAAERYEAEKHAQRAAKRGRPFDE